MIDSSTLSLDQFDKPNLVVLLRDGGVTNCNLQQSHQNLYKRLFDGATGNYCPDPAAKQQDSHLNQCRQLLNLLLLCRINKAKPGFTTSGRTHTQHVATNSQMHTVVHVEDPSSGNTSENEDCDDLCKSESRKHGWTDYDDICASGGGGDPSSSFLSPI